MRHSVKARPVIDEAAAGRMTGGSETDWFWSYDQLDYLNHLPTEPHNAFK